MEIAVIGSGISGLYSAYKLAPDHKVTLYESDSRLGGHANTVTVNQGPSPLNIDTGFIVHNDRNYPLLTELFDELGVDTQDSEMSFSVAAPADGIFYRATNLSTLFAHKPNLRNKAVWRMLWDILRFNRIGRSHLKSGSQDLTTEEFCELHNLSSEFIEYYLRPLGASIWSSSPANFLQFPATSLLRFLDNHGLISLGNRPQWKTVVGGSKTYVDKVAASIENEGAEILTDTPVQRVENSSGRPTVFSAAGRHSYDKVIFASHSDQSLALLGDPTQLQQELLGAIEYQPNEATLHTDESLLPPLRQNWASWNYSVGLNNDPSSPTLTYDLTLLQRLPTSRRYLVSLNSDEAIDESSVIAKSSYAHPVYNPAAIAAQHRYDELLAEGKDTNFYFCGAYWHFGFHEDGAKSASQVVKAIQAHG